MITHVSRPQTRRVLMVDDELANPTTAGGRAVRALADELRARGIEVVEAYSCEDGTATVISDSALHCVLVNWTLGNNDRRSHDQATELLRALRARNATVPVYLMADRRAADVTDRGGDAGRRVHLAARGHRDLRRRPGRRPRSSATSRRCCRPSPRRWPATTGSGSTPGRRPATRAAWRSSSRRSAGCSSTTTGRTSSGPTWGSSGARWARCWATPARWARASGTRPASSAPIAPTRSSTGPRAPTGPSCRPAWATPRSRCATGTATSPSSRDWC